jgi:adenylate cyclase
VWSVPARPGVPAGTSAQRLANAAFQHDGGQDPEGDRGIKTMGDGVMCAFYRLDDALATAIRLQDEVGGWCQDQGIDPPLALKVGVHHGPAIAMTANGRLDYFGRTVNLAARVADQSRGGDVVVLREVLDQAGRPAPGGPGLAAEPFTTRLRGLDSGQHLVRLA